jgi:hypothetical protein
MKVKKSDLRKVLKEFVPKAVSQSVQPSVRPESTPISKVPGSSGVFLRIKLPDLEDVEINFVKDPNSAAELTLDYFKEKYEGIKADVGGYAIESIIKDGVIPIPRDIANSDAMADIEANPEFSKTLLYRNAKVMENKRRSASNAVQNLPKITVIGVYRSKPFEDDTSGTASSHVVIRTKDVENLIKAIGYMLCQPAYEQDLENIRRIMFFLSGDSAAFEDAFGNSNSFGSSILNHVRSKANKYLGTYFDDKDFERTAGILNIL